MYCILVYTVIDRAFFFKYKMFIPYSACCTQSTLRMFCFVMLVLVKCQGPSDEPYNISVLRALSNSEGMLIGGKKFHAPCRIMKLINEFHVVEQ
jgi:hypothetical protein